MKNLKITLQMLTLLLFATLASCKKDNGTAPEVEATPIATDELLGHYITLTINGDPSLRLLYFSKEGNEVKEGPKKILEMLCRTTEQLFVKQHLPRSPSFFQVPKRNKMGWWCRVLTGDTRIESSPHAASGLAHPSSPPRSTRLKKKKTDNTTPLNTERLLFGALPSILLSTMDGFSVETRGDATRSLECESRIIAYDVRVE